MIMENAISQTDSIICLNGKKGHIKATFCASVPAALRNNS